MLYNLGCWLIMIGIAHFNCFGCVSKWFETCEKVLSRVGHCETAKFEFMHYVDSLGKQTTCCMSAKIYFG